MDDFDMIGGKYGLHSSSPEDFSVFCGKIYEITRGKKEKTGIYIIGTVSDEKEQKQI
ncbi:MAG: hypothetical protein K5739_01670 [Lachnospiraceae bacterium]|nr:hypothetical protein [Lachnospiraceae bacterium]